MTASTCSLLNEPRGASTSDVRAVTAVQAGTTSTGGRPATRARPPLRAERAAARRAPRGAARPRPARASAVGRGVALAFDQHADAAAARSPPQPPLDGRRARSRPARGRRDASHVVGIGRHPDRAVAGAASSGRPPTSTTSVDLAARRVDPRHRAVQGAATHTASPAGGDPRSAAPDGHLTDDPVGPGVDAQHDVVQRPPSPRPSRGVAAT